MLLSQLIINYWGRNVRTLFVAPQGCISRLYYNCNNYNYNDMIINIEPRILEKRKKELKSLVIKLRSVNILAIVDLIKSTKENKKDIIERINNNQKALISKWKSLEAKLNCVDEINRLIEQFKKEINDNKKII